MRKEWSRRQFLQISSGAAGLALLAACAPPAAVPAEPMAEAPAAAPAAVEAPGTAEGGLLRPSGSPKRGGTVRMAVGARVDVPLRPALLLEQDGTLLGRWLVERP